MARARIPDTTGWQAVEAAAGPNPSRDDLALAVRFTLQVLAEQHPGNAIEVRVPPFGAVQCGDGPRHTRGTPPNVIETAPEVWLALATGQRDWSSALTAGELTASGSRADLTGVLPLKH